MKYLVTNVDDLGLHPAVERAVRKLHRLGIVSSSSLMANMPFVNSCQDLNGTLGFSAHLNILRGRPLSDPNEVSSLLGDDGMFLGNYGTLFKRYRSGKIPLDEIRLEWKRQIEHLMSLGYTLTHIDSEKHIHAWPGLSTIAVELAEIFDLPFVRRPREPFQWPTPTMDTLRRLLLNRWSKQFPSEGSTKYPRYVLGLTHQGTRLRPNAIANLLSRCPDNSVIELCCHPAQRNSDDPPLPEGMGNTRVEALWEPEFESLSDDAWLTMLKTHDIQLCHYGQIP